MQMQRFDPDNHPMETLKLTPAERAADQAEFVFLLMQVWGESGCHSVQLCRDLERADYIAKRLARKAK